MIIHIAKKFLWNSKNSISLGIQFEINHGFWFDTVFNKSSNYSQSRSDGNIFRFLTSDDSTSTLAFGLVLPDVDLLVGHWCKHLDITFVKRLTPDDQKIVAILLAQLTS